MGVAAKQGNVVGGGANQRALIADEHDFVAVEDLHGAHQIAVAGAGAHGDDALHAAPLHRELVGGRALAVAALAGREDGARRIRHDQRDHAVLAGEADAAHAARRASHGPHGRCLEARRLAGTRHQQHVVFRLHDGHADQRVARFQRQGDQAGVARARELRERGLLDRAVGGGHEDARADFGCGWRGLFRVLFVLVVRLRFGVFFLGFNSLFDVGALGLRQDGRDAFAVGQRQHVHQRAALGGGGALRNVEDAQPVHLAGVGEAQQRVMAVGDQQVFDEVLVAQAGGGAPGAAPPLRLVDAERLPLGVAAMGDGDHGIFLGDEVFVREV